jgi:hypothetical protein
MDFRHFGISRTKAYGVDAAFMLLERHGWDIHALSTEPGRAAGGIGGHGSFLEAQEYQASSANGGPASGPDTPAMM